MNKRYKVTLASRATCKSLGVKFEGQEERIRLWLTGVASGISYVSNAHFHLFFTCKTHMLLTCDHNVVLNNVKDRLEAYGCKVEEISESIGVGTDFSVAYTNAEVCERRGIAIKS